MNIIKNLYKYRELLKTNTKKDVGGKYKNSFLGILWSFINPLLQIAVYALVGNSSFRRSRFACSVVFYYFIVYHPYPVVVVCYAVCA